MRRRKKRTKEIPLKESFNAGGHFMFDVYADGTGRIRGSKRPPFSPVVTAVFKYAVQKKGHTVTPDDIPVLFPDTDGKLSAYSTVLNITVFKFQSAGYPKILKKTEDLNLVFYPK